MKKNSFLISLLALSGLIFFACGSEDKKQEITEQTINEIIAKADSILPNYRYVDLDTVLAKYNLAKDYNEEMLRMQTNMENEVKRHDNSIKSFATTVQQKYQNNGYLTQESFDADQKKINDMQVNAQKAITNLQSNFETSVMQAQKTVNDSIEAFIKEYNMKKGYDAIFFKAATLYINPALDITNDVVEGLNARYNKVK
ncbi:MAG: OmpH family outer membrane protein [Muribaculaceae bacterium]|nr:OmpH family outer membrane protein [Muribaculaceae bacterium]